MSIRFALRSYDYFATLVSARPVRRAARLATGSIALSLLAGAAACSGADATDVEYQSALVAGLDADALEVFDNTTGKTLCDKNGQYFADARGNIGLYNVVSNITTYQTGDDGNSPLRIYFDDPALATWKVPTDGLTDPDKAPRVKGGSLGAGITRAGDNVQTRFTPGVNLIGLKWHARSVKTGYSYGNGQLACHHQPRSAGGGGGGGGGGGAPPSCANDWQDPNKSCAPLKGRCNTPDATKLSADCNGSQYCDTAHTCATAPGQPPNGFPVLVGQDVVPASPFANFAADWSNDQNAKPSKNTGSSITLDTSTYMQIVSKFKILKATDVGLYVVSFGLSQSRDKSAFGPWNDVSIAASPIVPNAYQPASADAGHSTLRPTDMPQTYSFLAQADGRDNYLKFSVDCEAIYGCTSKTLTISDVHVYPLTAPLGVAVNMINSDFASGLSPWVGSAQDQGGATQTVDPTQHTVTLFRKFPHYLTPWSGSGGTSEISRVLEPIGGKTTYKVDFAYGADPGAQPAVYLRSPTTGVITSADPGE